jgi:hypothetical protein
MNPLQVIEELSFPEGLPVEAIRAAQADRDAMVPVFLRTIDDFLSLEGSGDPYALFFMFHLLGEWREKSAYWPLAVLLRLPPEVVDTILGEAITETTHRVMAAVFDGDPEPLYEIIRDPEADEFVRAKMCQVIAMLVRRGELPRDVAAGFLLDCSSQLEPKQDCYVWSGWIDAVAWLGLTELKPVVKEAFLRGSIDPEWLTFRDFEEDLQYTVDRPDAEPLHPDGKLTLFGDTVAELSGWDCFKPKAKDSAAIEMGADVFGTSDRAPLRKVGRNDPCPCGSGKKFKKCCLTSAFDPLSEGSSSGKPVGPVIRNR